MELGSVRSVEDRLADRTWRRGERLGFLLTVATLGCFTFAWFGIHALRQFHTSRRTVDESWALAWGVVAWVSLSLGGGLSFATDADAAISVLVWAVRLGSLFHVYADHGARMRRLAVREVEREWALIAPVRGSGTVPAWPGTPGRPGAAGAGRFEAPASDPFATGRQTRPAPPAPAPAPAPPVRGRSWGRPGRGAPAPDSGRRLESPALPPTSPQPAAPAAHDVPSHGRGPTWVPDIEPLDGDTAGRGERRGGPAEPSSGRVLDL